MFADLASCDHLVAAFEEDIGCDSIKTVVWVDVEGKGLEIAAGPPKEGLGWLPYESCFVAQEGAQVDLAALRELATADKSSINDGYHMYYTSGTTGKPKGVVLSHKIVVHHAVAITKGMCIIERFKF